MRWAAALLAVGAVVGGASADPPPAGYQGAGEAPVSGGDRVRARERALDEAFRQVIDQALAQQLDAAALAERAPVIKLSLHPRARSYILRYAVLEEGDQGGIFRIRISADVMLYQLMQDVRSAGSVPAPRTGDSAAARVIACVVERAGDRWVPSALGRRVADSLVLRGVDTTVFDGDCAPAGADPLPGADKMATQIISRRARGAVAGALLTRPTGSIHGTSLQSAHVELRLHVLDGEAHFIGEIRVERDGWGADAMAAAATATEPAILEALAKLPPLADRAFPRPSGLSVLLGRADKYADLASLLRALGTIPGVVLVEPRRFSAEGIEIHVESALTAPALGAGLARLPEGARFIATVRDARTLMVRPAPPPPPTDVAVPPAAPLLPSLPR